jgi:hypothetical protein
VRGVDHDNRARQSHATGQAETRLTRT